MLALRAGRGWGLVEALGIEFLVDVAKEKKKIIGP